MAYVISDDCIACGTCIDECPVEAISEGDIYSINPDVCTDCGTCADVCPSEAIHPAELYKLQKMYRLLSTEGSLFYFLSSPQITQMDTGYLYSTKL